MEISLESKFIHFGTFILRKYFMKIFSAQFTFGFIQFIPGFAQFTSDFAQSDSFLAVPTIGCSASFQLF